MKTVFLALGSNIGDREENMQTAVTLIGEHDSIEVEQISSFIETAAVSKWVQPHFLNGVIQIKTILTPMELLEFTQDIEKRLGRQTKENGDPRTIDIDILFYEQELICAEFLTIPHPLIQDRGFVLTPLNEIAPEFVHPILQETVSILHHRLIGINNVK